MPGKDRPGAEWLKYHQATKYAVPPARLEREEWPPSWVRVDYKQYPKAAKEALPTPTLDAPASLLEVLAGRRTTRAFARQRVATQALSQLLHLACGLRVAGAPDIGNRTYPSAGARYPLEIYSAVRSVEGVERGLYHYLLLEHALEQLGRSRMDTLFNSLVDDWMRDASLLIIVTAIFERNFRKYGQRGYRDVLIEAGHVGQNLALVSTALGLGWCGVGAYLDDVVNEAIGIDGTNETVIAMHLIGLPAASSR